MPAGTITTTYDSQTVTTTGSPPTVGQHKTDVKARFASNPPNLVVNNGIETSWTSAAGDQAFEATHSPAAQTIEAWEQAWENSWRSKGGQQTPI